MDATTMAKTTLPATIPPRPEPSPSIEQLDAQRSLLGVRLTPELLRAEFSTTIFSGIIGGICVTLFGMQPASATGAMLQEALHFVRDPGTVAAGTVMDRQGQILTLLQFAVMLSAIAVGTGWGRVARVALEQSQKRSVRFVLRIMVSIMSAVAVACLSHTLHHEGRTLSSWSQTWVCALFGFDIGLLWGIMPGENITTARTFLLKRAALGDLWALRQIVLFLFCVGFTVSVYHAASTTLAPLRLLGTIVIVIGLLDTGYMASSSYLDMPLPIIRLGRTQLVAPIASLLLLTVFAGSTFQFLKTVEASGDTITRIPVTVPMNPGVPAGPQ
jgi:hypothetical protein